MTIFRTCKAMQNDIEKMLKCEFSVLDAVMSFNERRSQHNCVYLEPGIVTFFIETEERSIVWQISIHHHTSFSKKPSSVCDFPN